MRGLFVTFEGIDRSGKTTQARLLTEALGSDALGVREPGGTEAGERVREILKDPAVPLAPEAEALLFAAARAELVADVILPSLASGRVVVSDRFLDSSLAYQGGARGLGIDDVERVNRFAARGLRPDLTFLLEISPCCRGAARGGERPLRGRGRGAAGGGAVGLRAADRDRSRALAASRRHSLSFRDSCRGPGRGGDGAGGGVGMSLRVLDGTADHPQARIVLGNALASQPSHAYLFHGPAGVGKRTVARAFAAELLAVDAEDPDDVRLRVAHGTHPDLTWVTAERRPRDARG